MVQLIFVHKVQPVDGVSHWPRQIPEARHFEVQSDDDWDVGAARMRWNEVVEMRVELRDSFKERASGFAAKAQGNCQAKSTQSRLSGVVLVFR